MHRKTPLRLIRTMRFHSSSVISAAAVIGCSTPALLTAKSSRPNASSALSSAAFTSSGRDTSHLTASAPAEFLDHAGGLPVAFFRDIGDHQVCVLARECQRRRASDAGRPSGYKRNPSSERSIVVHSHFCSLLSLAYLARYWSW